MAFYCVRARSLNCSMRKASAFLWLTISSSHSHRKSTRLTTPTSVRSSPFFSGYRQGDSVPRLYQWKDLPCPTGCYTPASQKDSKEERVTPQNIIGCCKGILEWVKDRIFHIWASKATSSWRSEVYVWVYIWAKRKSDLRMHLSWLHGTWQDTSDLNLDPLCSNTKNCKQNCSGMPIDASKGMGKRMHKMDGQ